MSWFGSVGDGYEALIGEIIRPPRDVYDLLDLGDEVIMHKGQRYCREDLTLESRRQGGGTLQCSRFAPEAPKRGAALRPVVVFLHANSASRLEALNVLKPVLSAGADLFCFDFCGSGRSDGEYVSLGHFEKDDLAAVVEYLRGTGTVSTIGLWGHSMGAAAALLHADRDPSIAGMVLDSPFTDLRKLASELCERAGFSYMFAGAAITAVDWAVWSRAGFALGDLSPVAHVSKTFIPAIFIAGEQDDFIGPHHSRELHEAYASHAEFIPVRGGHNDPRPRSVLDRATAFFQEVL